MKSKRNIIKLNSERRKKRTRAKIRGTAERPRISVFKSNKHIYAQVIDDSKGVTLLAASDYDLKPAEKTKHKEEFFNVGKFLAKKAGDTNIKRVVFDRGSYKFHGRVKELARGLREGGLEF